jgi:hypothetical protein
LYRSKNCNFFLNFLTSSFQKDRVSPSFPFRLYAGGAKLLWGRCSRQALLALREGGGGGGGAGGGGGGRPVVTTRPAAGPQRARAAHVHRALRLQYIVYFISFIYVAFFSFTFYNKFDETYQFFLCKTAHCVKRQDFFKNIFIKLCFMVSNLRVLN